MSTAWRRQTTSACPPQTCSGPLPRSAWPCRAALWGTASNLVHSGSFDEHEGRPTLMRNSRVRWRCGSGPPGRRRAGVGVHEEQLPGLVVLMNFTMLLHGLTAASRRFADVLDEEVEAMGQAHPHDVRYLSSSSLPSLPRRPPRCPSPRAPRSWGPTPQSPQHLGQPRCVLDLAFGAVRAQEDACVRQHHMTLTRGCPAVSVQSLAMEHPVRTPLRHDPLHSREDTGVGAPEAWCADGRR
jgi:hypothetical protein